MAWSIDSNPWTLRRSSRSEPLKVSTKLVGKLSLDKAPLQDIDA